MALHFQCRSLLYVPGSNPKVLAKSKTLAVDLLILDLEDSVSFEAKPVARRNIVQFMAETVGSVQQRTVRINALSSAYWQEDVKAILPSRPDAIVIPKVEDAQQLLLLDDLLQPFEQESGTPMALIPMIESPLAVQNAYAIASHDRVVGLLMGTSDLAKDLRVAVVAGRQPLYHVLAQTILAARSAKRAVFDGVFVDLEDMDGFEQECRQAAQWGFDGKSIIHPKQIEAVNRCFMPSAEELQQAKRVIEAWQQAAAKGEEICVVDGRLVERLHVEVAKTRWQQGAFFKSDPPPK